MWASADACSQTSTKGNSCIFKPFFFFGTHSEQCLFTGNSSLPKALLRRSAAPETGPIQTKLLTLSSQCIYWFQWGKLEIPPSSSKARAEKEKRRLHQQPCSSESHFVTSDTKQSKCQNAALNSSGGSNRRGWEIHKNKTEGHTALLSHCAPTVVSGPETYS